MFIFESEIKHLKEAAGVENLQADAKRVIYFHSSHNLSFSCFVLPAKLWFSHPVTGKKNLTSPLGTSLTDLGAGRCAV